jgi:hypothetical protein
LKCPATTTSVSRNVRDDADAPSSSSSSPSARSSQKKPLAKKSLLRAPARQHKRLKEQVHALRSGAESKEKNHHGQLAEQAGGGG